ncbi:ribosome maturation factor RimM [Microscilla marina]|uniref:Ribosome maturation factor RimM n=1 Tax=Microscilla marina ATCC 23134 TaxID=313606 RepID=A1ZGD2_MICM2|nr:ribosome maturation factor RimM [Microscilla marina]EAY30549.1 16S rRNA processing protein RimM [Microscilla marina ATCC 23134]
MNFEDCYEVGYIAKTYGVKGEIHAVFDVDNSEEYREIESIFVVKDRHMVPYFIEQVRFVQGYVRLKFEEIDDVDQAKMLVGSKLMLPIDVLPETEEEEYYFHDILGYMVVDADKGEIGKVTQLYDSTNQDLIGVTHQGKEVLIPYIKDQIIQKLDHEQKVIVVTLPGGLLDVYLEDE